MTKTAIPTASATLPQLRFSLASAAEDAVPGVSGLLQFAQSPATGSTNAAADAALLLGSRGAVILDFGTEIGLNTFPAPDKTTGTKEAKALPLMQWTPSNHTPAPTEDASAKPSASPAAGSVTEFGAYHPYRPPPRSLTGAVPAPVRVVADPNIPSALPAADTLPGFTAGTLPMDPQSGATINVITQDRDPRSLLNLYRQLIALHHDNGALHNGAQTVLNHDAENTLVWVRRIPLGARTAANVVAAANMGEQPVTLALDGDLAPLGIRPGVLRPIFTSAATALTGETTGRLLLPPHAVFFGEISGGRLIPPDEPAPRARRGRRRRRR
jgi:glycosidase